MSTDEVGWDRVLSCREFWLLYYELALDWDSNAGREKWGMRPHTEQTIRALAELLNGREVCIPLPRGYGLAVVFNGGAWHGLHLLHGRKKTLLGWVDPHFHPDVFRWSEFQRIVTAATSLRESPLSQAAIYLLLFMYIGFSGADDLPSITHDLKRQLRDTGLYSAREINLFASWLSAADSRAAELTWVQQPQRGWVVEGGYSLRTLEPGYTFDFKTFQRFIQDYES
jgi:hypothetical protein